LNLRSHDGQGAGLVAELPQGGCVIDAVVFDVGECLVDETREYGTWADWLGVPRHVFSAVFGVVIARGHASPGASYRYLHAVDGRDAVIAAALSDLAAHGDAARLPKSIVVKH
jgi:hypothetical protein